MGNKSIKSIIFVLLVAAIGVGAWYTYTQSPVYIAKRNMEQAQAAISQQRIGDAAQLLQKVSVSNTGMASAAREQLMGLVTAQSLQTAAAEQAALAINIVKELKGAPDLTALTWPVIESRVTPAPKDALQLLDAIASLESDAEKVQNTRLTVLESLVKMEPGNKDFAIDLALLYEPKGDISRIESLLSPHKDQLGISEGARLLGQVYAAQNRIQEAYDLLSPYTEKKLAVFHQAETEYNQLLDDIWKQTIVYLNAGKAPDSFYNEYDKADKNRQNEMVQTQYAARRDQSPEVEAALEAYRDAASVVPVALDLGMVMLRRAQTLTDEEQRKTDLQSAEKTFLAVKGVAGQSDEYRLYLAQVYYWLGKAKEGKVLFEELLTAKNRDFSTLFSIGRILRDLGASGESRELMQEAYKKASGPDEAHPAASYLSLLATSVKERIKWLEKSDLSSAQVQADLASLRGNEAEENSKLTQAAIYYRETIDGYEKLVKNPTTLNNVALAYFSLYRVSGDQNALNTGLIRIDEAITLAPSDSIILMNAADELTSAACRAVIGDKINLAKLRSAGNLYLLSFLYNDDTQRRAVAKRLSQHPAMVKAVSYLEKAMILAPKQDLPYQQLASLYALFEDIDGMKRVSNMLAKIDIDLQDAMKRYEEYYTGVKDQYYSDLNSKKIQEYRTLRDSLKPAGSYSHVVANANIINAYFSQLDFGQKVDLDELVSLAKNNYERLPSSATRSNYQNALLIRAMESTKRNDKTVSELMNKYSRTLSHRYLMLVGLENSAQLKQNLARNKDIQTFMGLVKEELRNTPSSMVATDWALLHHFEPTLADKIKPDIQANQVNHLGLAISERLNPPNASLIYNKYWYRRMDGENEAAHKILQDAAAKGVSLPLI